MLSAHMFHVHCRVSQKFQNRLPSSKCFVLNSKFLFQLKYDKQKNYFSMESQREGPGKSIHTVTSSELSHTW